MHMGNKPFSQCVTQLEVLLVLVGLIATLMMVTRADPVNVPQEEERLLSSLRWAAQQAVLEGTLYAVQLDRYGWTLVRQTCAPDQRGQSPNWPDYVWRPVAFGHHSFPAGITLELMVANQPQPLPASDAEAADSEPQIFLLPGGEVTPFALWLRASEPTGRYLGWRDGQIMLLTSR